VCCSGRAGLPGRRHGCRGSGYGRRIASSPPQQLTCDDYDPGAKPHNHPQREQCDKQKDSDEILEGSHDVHVPLIGGIKRNCRWVEGRGPGPMGRRASKRFDAGGQLGPIVQPAVRRPQSLHTNARRPVSRLKRSSWPAIRHRIRAGRNAAQTRPSREAARTAQRTFGVAAAAHAVAVGGRPCHASTAVTESSQSASR
jgi:hypothetical protein